MTKEEAISNQGVVIAEDKIGFKNKILAAMDEYAKDQMATLLNNISRLPVEVYSEKVKGQDKKYFLGRKFVEDLIKRIK